MVNDGNDGNESRRFLPKYGGHGRTYVSNEGDAIVTSSRRALPSSEMLYALELWRVGLTRSSCR